MLKISRIKLASKDAMSDEELCVWLGQAGSSGLDSKNSILEGFTAQDLLKLSLREEVAKQRIQSLEQRLSKLENLDFEESDQFQDSLSTLDPVITTHWEWCHPGDRNQPVWMLMFDDTERGAVLYYDEKEARTAFAVAEGRGWNCHLLSSVRRISE